MEASADCVALFTCLSVSICVCLYVAVSVCVCASVSACSDAWTDSVALLHVDASSLINKHAHRIIGELTNLSALSQVCLSFVSFSALCCLNYTACNVNSFVETEGFLTVTYTDYIHVRAIQSVFLATDEISLDRCDFALTKTCDVQSDAWISACIPV